MERDTLTLEGDPQEGEPLIEKVMEKGRRLFPSPSLDAIRERVREQLERLPPPLKAIEKQPPYPVHISKALQDLARAIDEGRV